MMNGLPAALFVIDPHNAGPYFNRASAEDALGNRTAAIADMQRFLELANDEEWRETGQRLLDDWQGKPNTFRDGDSAASGAEDGPP